MNYLQLVQKTVRKSGAKVSVPTTVVGQTGLSFLFVEWVQEAWKNIQLERLGIGWRVERDRTLDLVANIREYIMPTDLESIDLETLTIHLSDENESKLYFIPYEVYREQFDRVQVDAATTQATKPVYFTLSPVDNKFIFTVKPDDTYTVRYEGIRRVQEFSLVDIYDQLTQTTELADDQLPTNLLSEYHDAIVWEAVKSYAMNFEDGSKLREAQVEFLPYKKYFEQRYMPIVTLDTTALYGLRGRTA